MITDSTTKVDKQISCVAFTTNVNKIQLPETLNLEVDTKVFNLDKSIFKLYHFTKLKRLIITTQILNFKRLNKLASCYLAHNI